MKAKRKHKPDTAAVQVYVPKDLPRRFRALCVASDRTMADVIAQFMRECIAAGALPPSKR